LIEVVLERGWSELLLFEDAEGDLSGNFDFGRTFPPLAGVEVRADGALAGASDGDGLLLLARAAPPVELEVHLPGWSVVNEVCSGSLRRIKMLRAP
jgi:hypothetical protein